MRYNFLVDSHCHLDLLEQKQLDVRAALKNAAQNEVRILQTICTRITEFEKIYHYAEKFSNVFASIGIHPNNVDEQPKIKASDLLEMIQKNPKIIGIGETGLDYYYQNSSKESQQLSFIQHISAARTSALPLIIHSRDADADMIAILREQLQECDFKILLHCFSSSKKMAEEALELGAYFSIAGIVTFKNAQDLQEIVRDLPLNRILVETDAPYLAPVPHRGSLNQPAYTKHTAEFIADLKKLDKEEFFSATTANFLHLFDRIPSESVSALISQQA